MRVTNVTFLLLLPLAPLALAFAVRPSRRRTFMLGASYLVYAWFAALFAFALCGLWHQWSLLEHAALLHVVILYGLVLSAPLGARLIDRARQWESRSGGPNFTLRVARGFVLGAVSAAILVFWGGHSPFIYLQF